MVLDSRLEFSNVDINNWRTHIKMNVIIIPLAGHYRRFLFLFLCVNLFKRKKKLFVLDRATVVFSDSKKRYSYYKKPVT